MVGKRHASGEIAVKLAQANDLAAKGKTQREIAKALGVSIMTFHRWKKLVSAPDGRMDGSGRSGSDLSSGSAVRQLEIENSRLRRLVTDLLLEKLKLEEDLRARQEARFRRPRDPK